jgi:tartrate dehydrogenase/decarboxylase/D-malate dehydrogenase
MKNFSIAVIPADGIGIEVMSEAEKVLNRISEISHEVKFKFEHYPWGCEYYLKHGKMMDEDGLDKLKNYDAILLGAVGYPGVPDHISLRELLLKIRQGFNQYINYRPVKLLDENDCPLKDKKPEDIDMLFIRENKEGEYVGAGGFLNEGKTDEVAVQTSVFTRSNTEKVMRFAFEEARKRNKKKHVTSITKSNALNYSMVFWDRVFREISREYPEISTSSYHVDAASMFMVQKPHIFDVVVASNLFGDILTDLGASLQGGLGFAAGANINPEREYPSMFEPVHGSAPDIAGKGLANPLAMLWTVSIMLDFLDLKEMSVKLLNAVCASLKDRERLTPDFKGRATTEKVGDYICELLEKEYKEGKC